MEITGHPYQPISHHVLLGHSASTDPFTSTASFEKTNLSYADRTDHLPTTIYCHHSAISICHEPEHHYDSLNVTYAVRHVPVCPVKTTLANIMGPPEIILYNSAVFISFICFILLWPVTVWRYQPHTPRLLFWSGYSDRSNHLLVCCVPLSPACRLIITSPQTQLLTYARWHK